MADDDVSDAHAATRYQQPPIYRPIPRRNFSSHSGTSESPLEHSQQLQQLQSPPSSDFLAQLNARLLRTHNARSNIYDTNDEGRPPAKNKSLLNMTRSTLFGIYDDVGDNTASEQSVAETPWGTGAETPGMPVDAVTRNSSWEGGPGSPDAGLRMKGLARRGIPDAPQTSRSRRGTRPLRRGASRYAVVAAKLSALFLFGVVYGVIVSHLHDTRELATVRIGQVGRESWIYLVSWGLAGTVLGSLVPYVDLLWGPADGDAQEKEGKGKESESSLWEQWNEVMRSVGAFVGIAFAIRRLPWQSTLQLTITLALVNPALWYILDRSRPGLSVSLVVTSLTTSFIFLSNPDVLPSPSLPATTNNTHVSGRLPSPRSPAPSARLPSGDLSLGKHDLFAGMVSYETLAVVTWVGSVLFCSCVCFGNIGRRLDVLGEWRGKL